MNCITWAHALLSTRGWRRLRRGYLHLNWLATALADDGAKWYDDYNYNLCVTG